ncbi:MAG: RluA family pseudouridine synthase [Planctomycetota bacterium]
MSARPLEASRVLHLDDDICIVDKPDGLLSVDAPGQRPTLVARLAATLRSRGVSAELLPVHRLDEGTSGALLLARHDLARKRLIAQFKRHEVERVYYALVLGSPYPLDGSLSSRLREDARGMVRVVASGGRQAVTHYRTLARLSGFSLVACRLDTGRRNQIRVQLADVGCPVLGDRKYGRGDPRFGKLPAPRTMLHATGISLKHPLSRKPLVVVAPLPEDFRQRIGDGLARRLTP